MNTKQTNAELIDYKFQIMNDELKNQTVQIEKLHSKMDAFIEASQKTYATKEEHEENKRAIQEMQSLHKGIILKGFLGFGTALIAILSWIGTAIAKKLNIF